jgi:dolichyl-phosphate-mannose--protein O-mannosyl transferase
MYLWALALFHDGRIAIWVAVITLLNNLLYVQARIGMLDTFMGAFLVWGLAAFTEAWSSRTEAPKAYRLLLFSGVMMGLAMATKWAAVVPWVACLILVGLLRLFQAWSITFLKPAGTGPKHEEFYHLKLWSGLSNGRIAIALGLVPLVVYAIPFLPFLFVHRTPAYTLWDLVLMQPKMWDGQLRVVTKHPYMSTWLQWPLLKRPIWYAFDKEGPTKEWVRGVLLLGNPVIMWTGLVAITACLWEWVRSRSRSAFLIVYFYSAFFFCWAVIPRKIAFYYYYYPAGMILGFALAFVFFRWDGAERDRSREFVRWTFATVVAAFFIYFFPILAGLRIPSETFRKWMWFSTWI